MPEEQKTKNTLEEEIRQQLTPEEPRESSIVRTNGPLKSLRTYQGDIENVIGQKKTSIASIAIAEHKRQEQRREETPITQSFFTELTNKSFVTAGIGLVLLGLIIVGAGYLIKNLDFSTPSSQKETVVSFTKKIDVSIATTTRTQFIQSILAEKNNSKSAVNSLVYFNTTTKSAPSDVSDVLKLIAPGIPGTLIRSLEKVYMIGVYTFDTQEPFIILTTNDYAQSYSGMLKWEDTMSRDLGEIFSIPQNTATSTMLFTDEAINNKDLRILTDSSKKTILLYSFLDKNTIFITANEAIFTALLNKFITSKMVR